MLVLGPCDDVPGVQVESFDTEAAMLERFSRLLQDEGTDVLVGYNTWQVCVRHCHLILHCRSEILQDRLPCLCNL